MAEKTVTIVKLSATVPCIFSPLLYRLSLGAEARMKLTSAVGARSEWVVCHECDLPLLLL